MSLKDNRQLRKFLPEGSRELWRGKIVEVNGSTTVTDNPLFCWVRPERGGQPLAIYNDAAPHEKGRRVSVGNDSIDKRVRVLRGRWTAGTTQTVNPNVGPHGASHGPEGTDTVYIKDWQIMDLRVYPTSGMNVHCNGGEITYQGKPVHVEPTDLDISSSIPVSGARYSLIRLSSVGVWSVQDGTPVDSLADLTDDDVPTCAVGYAAISRARLYFGQTVLSKLTTNPDVVMLVWGGGLFDISESNPEDHSHIEISVYNVSNPPTETQLIAALGTPDEFTANGRVGLINDAATGNSAYVVFSDGGHFWLLPLTKAAETSISVAVDSSTTIAEEAGRWFGRASIARSDNGNLALAYYEASSHTASDGELHIRFSDDNGDNWSDEDKYLDDIAVTGFPMNPPDAGENEDAVQPLIIAADNGDLLILMLRMQPGTSLHGTYQSRSLDDGRTWNTPTVIGFDGIVDDDYIVAASEGYFIFEGTIYIAARQYTDGTGAHCEVILVKSEDDGETWEYVSDIYGTVDVVNEVGIEYLGNNTIIAIFRDHSILKTYKATSTDMGATWSALTDITSLVNTLGKPRIRTRSHLKGYANWWTDSVLIMSGFIFTTPGNNWGRRSAVWISQDRGETWDGPNYINAESDDGGYGDMFYDAINNLWVFVSNRGDADEADMIQYNLEITGI